MTLTGSLDSNAYLWNITTGQRIRAFAGHKGGINAVAFSPDGKTILTGSDDKTARLWNSFTGECIKSFTGNYSSNVTSDIYTVAFSPNGKSIITGSRDGTALLYDISDILTSVFKNSPHYSMIFFSYASLSRSTLSINVSTTIAEPISIEVYNISGQRVLAASASHFGNGSAKISLKKALPAGPYFYRIISTRGNVVVGLGRILAR
jgi:WD40 repeat protein